MTAPHRRRPAGARGERQAAVGVGREEALEALEDRLGRGVVELSAATRPARVKRAPMTDAWRSTPRSAPASSSIWSAISASTDAGRVSWSAPGAHRCDHLGDEERAAVGARGDRRGDVRGQRSVLGQLHDERAAAPGVERRERDAQEPLGGVGWRRSRLRARGARRRAASCARAIPPAMCPISAADASSMRWASSTTMSAAPGGSLRAAPRARRDALGDETLLQGGGLRRCWRPFRYC